MRRLRAIVVAAMLAGGAASARAEDVPIVEPPFTALAADAERYAAHYDVTPAEGEARLRAQAAIAPLVDRIRAEYAGRLAGIVLEHRPVFRLVVLLAGNDPVPAETAMLPGLAVPIVYRTDAAATIGEVHAAIVAHQAAIRALLLDPPGLGVDPRGGGMLVTIGARDAAAGPLEPAIAAIAGVPVRIVVPGTTADMALAGGGRLEAEDAAEHRRYACTAGFAVTDGGRAAISTAAHCPDAMTANGAPLSLIGAWGAGRQDVQIMAAPVALAPAFRVGTGTVPVIRPVTGIGTRARIVAGQFVCHQGFRDGTSCAEVATTDFAPPGDLCAGPCPPDWVAVNGPDCRHGDSGGPVFDGTIALGLFKGASVREGRCTLYYFMSLDALPDGWRVMTAASP